MFPNELILDYKQVAQCMKVSKGHIYNLASAKRLPFRINQGLAKSGVLIVEFARYLDSQVTPYPAQEPIPVAIKKGPGRPRGTTKASRNAQFFQSDLRTAVCIAEGLEALDDAVQFADDMTIGPDVGQTCTSEFEFSRLALMAQLKGLRTRFADVSLNISMSVTDSSDDVPNGEGGNDIAVG
jgi:predicted DNA-binding transcriptional regulator AlpA